MMEAAEQASVRRFVMVSAIGAHHREYWSEEIKPYYAAKHYADRMLRQSSLTYTIIRPGGLTNNPGTGHIAAAENIRGGSIPREDVAKTILLSLDEENTFRRSFDLISGILPYPKLYPPSKRVLYQKIAPKYKAARSYPLILRGDLSY